MNRLLQVVPVPVSREPVSLRAVERALADLRRGRPVAVTGGGGAAVLVLAAEATTAESLRTLADTAMAEPALVLTARRAAVLGLARIGLRPIVVTFDSRLSSEMVHALADPLSAAAPIPISPAASARPPPIPARPPPCCWRRPPACCRRRWWRQLPILTPTTWRNGRAGTTCCGSMPATCSSTTSPPRAR
ncbi:MAG: hypothetical protein U1E38_02340 [Rhodospirillales bacterium]